MSSQPALDAPATAVSAGGRLWPICITTPNLLSDAANPLPAAIKQNVANLGIFIFNHTLAVMTQPAPERLAILIDINREIAAGLRGPAAQAA